MNDSVVKEDKYENYLLVEGNDDKHVLSHRCHRESCVKRRDLLNTGGHL